MTDSLHSPEPDQQVVIIGGGPAGLTAAYELTRHGRRPVVLEALSRVGGLARTEEYKGFAFDLGGHRFFTKVGEVEDLWHEILGTDLLHRPRLSRLYYRRRFFDYPLKPLNAFRGLGPLQTALILLSYLRWKLFPYPQEQTFEEWVTNRFGRRLFRMFFKAYTEKVWGIPCSTLRAEWAAQRIKGLSLTTAVLSMFIKPKTRIKSLVTEFLYPRRGPGMMWSAVRDAVERRGGVVRLNTPVLRIARTGSRIDAVVVAGDGRPETITGAQFISSMAVTDLVRTLTPPPPAEVLDAAGRLTYRDFLTVCLIVNRPQVFPDNWIYVHDPDVRVGRIQNFKNWSPEMVPDPSKTGLGLEYFCSEDDDLWALPDAELIALGTREMERIGLVRPGEVEDGCVVRVSKAYPVYDEHYREHLEVLRRFVDRLENLQTVGRNGLHRYNNQDHAMLTGILAARNIALQQRRDLWNVNTEPEYLEEIVPSNGTEGEDGRAGSGRAAPREAEDHPPGPQDLGRRGYTRAVSPLAGRRAERR
jgi:protoporphyrinogen oxidase